jgi:hypothetical protein
MQKSMEEKKKNFVILKFKEKMDEMRDAAYQWCLKNETTLRQIGNILTKK